MEEKSFILKFQSNDYQIPPRFHGIYQCSPQVYNDLVFSSNHTHIVSSIVKEEIFQSLINFITKGIPPRIKKENFIEYLKINEEFQLLTDFIKKSEEEFGTDFQCLIQLCEISNEQDNSLSETYIARNLDSYLKNYMDEMMKLPVNNLYNIFNNQQRKLNDHELAYQFIKKVSEKNADFLFYFHH